MPASARAELRCCPYCLAFLRDPGLPDRERWRPATRPPFSQLRGTSLERLHAGADPVYLGPDALIEATVELGPRSGTSAPVATMTGSGDRFVLHETGGRFLAKVARRTYRLDDVHERRWSFVEVPPPNVHLPVLAYAALLLACRIIFGAPTTPAPEDRTSPWPPGR